MDYQTLVVACEELTRAAVEGEDLDTIQRRLLTAWNRFWDMKMDQYEADMEKIGRDAGC